MGNQALDHSFDIESMFGRPPCKLVVGPFRSGRSVGRWCEIARRDSASVPRDPERLVKYEKLLLVFLRGLQQGIGKVGTTGVIAGIIRSTPRASYLVHKFVSGRPELFDRAGLSREGRAVLSHLESLYGRSVRWLQ